jgi:predicted neuraminidase
MLSEDEGKTFERLGGSDVEGRTFDEHMILELQDGRLAMYVRTNYGIGISYSSDGGNTWSEGEDTGWGGPDSRFFIRRLKSGRILLINHYQYTGRSHLTAMLSEDEGKTWPYKLLLDERSSVSYPDAVEAPDGNIYIVYDRERGCFLNSLADAYACAREILTARITEEDILTGTLVSDGSYLQRVVSKLGEYADGDPYANF